MSIEVTGITKTFGSFVALKNVSIQFPSGQLVALLGPSGSGKTSLLRIIAGLEVADAGRVLFDGEDATQRTARDRRVGFVFQHYALFRHMTVYENVAFGLRVIPRSVRPSRAEIQDRVFRLLKLVQVDWLADRLPSQLSGGQRQRVALARALAVEPKVLLLDEPFGALDAKVRKELRRWLRRLHDEIHVTSVFVTHDVEEALEVSDRVVVMNEGRVVQEGTPDDVYEHAATPFVYDFLGSANRFRAEPPVAPDSGSDAPLQVAYARPHELELKRQDGGAGGIRGRIVYIHAIGPVVRVELQRLDSDALIEVELTKAQYREGEFRMGEEVYAKPRRVTVFDATGPAT